MNIINSSTESSVVTVIGAGTIGASWAALCLASGLRTRVLSRRKGIEADFTQTLRAFLPRAHAGAHDVEEMLGRLSLEQSLGDAVDGSAVVLECLEEDLHAKQKLFAELEVLCSSDTLLLSSTSTLTPDALGASMRDKSRVVVGHPLNPPHVIPLVEVVKSAEAPDFLVERVVEFYVSVGKKPVVIQKPIARFVANRLQAALLQECIHLVSEGVVNVSDLDEIVTRSVGVRWAVNGPFLSFHLGGGVGGIRHWLTHLGTGLNKTWDELGSPRMEPQLIDLIIDQTEAAYGEKDYLTLAEERDSGQLAVIDVLEGRRKTEQDSPPAEHNSVFYHRV